VLTLGVVTDLHFGPEARFDGKLRKLSSQAAALTRAFVRRMNEEIEPDLVVCLGDCIEDESHEADLARYEECLGIMRTAKAELVCVAGNHDRVNLGTEDLRRAWGMPPAGPLCHSLDRGGVHVSVLYSHERTEQDVTLGPAQLDWLTADLAATKLPVVLLVHHSPAEQDLRGNRWFEKAPHLSLIKDRARLREILERDGKTVLVVNGHLHWNHLDVIAGIPYVTLQSLIENVEDDAPGTPAAAHAVVRIGPRRVTVEVAGAEPCRYQFDR
jgi:3',5'-cyclic-AMP phosphodiesterase